jgi:hypothetical protein
MDELTYFYLVFIATSKSQQLFLYILNFPYSCKYLQIYFAYWKPLFYVFFKESVEIIVELWRKGLNGVLVCLFLIVLYYELIFVLSLPGKVMGCHIIQ